MRCWTIQATAFLLAMQKRGEASGAFHRVAREDQRAYRWMAEQTPGCHTAAILRCPIWVWHKHEGRRKPPDLRSAWHLPRGERGVRIELELSSDRVRLSQFEMWTWVLSGDYIPLSDAEDVRIERLRIAGKLTSQLVENSWSRVFDLACGAEDFWGKLSKRSVQGTVCSINRADIVNVKYFVAR